MIESFKIFAPQIPVIELPAEAKQITKPTPIQKQAQAPFLIKASFAIILKYFAIVDLLMDFFGKVNVRLSRRLQGWVNDLNSLAFPEIKFLQKLSPIDDGGEKAVNEYEKRIAEERLKNAQNISGQTSS